MNARREKVGRHRAVKIETVVNAVLDLDARDYPLVLRILQSIHKVPLDRKAAKKVASR